MLTRRERTEVLVESGPALALELAGLKAGGAGRGPRPLPKILCRRTRAL